jgi:hypothetical protein
MPTPVQALQRDGHLARGSPVVHSHTRSGGIPRIHSGCTESTGTATRPAIYANLWRFATIQLVPARRIQRSPCNGKEDWRCDTHFDPESGPI